MPSRPFLLTVLLAGALFAAAITVTAAEPRFKAPDPAIPIPGVNFSDVGAIDENAANCPQIRTGGALACIHVPWLGEYLVGLYTFAVSAATMLATIVLLVAGYLWLTAGGNVNRIGLAQSYASGALLGLLLMLGSYVLLLNINPALVRFEALHIAVVDRQELPQVSILENARNCQWAYYEDSARFFPNSPDISPASEISACEIGQEPGSPSDCPGERRATQVCCCQPLRFDLNNDGITDAVRYQIPFVRKQMEHAHPALATFINCLQQKIPTQITINSISDNNIIRGTCEPWKENETFGASESSGNCQHSRGSAHYGGSRQPITENRRTGFSCAVDIDDNIPWETARNAAELCGAKKPTMRGTTDWNHANEGHHYHFFVEECGTSY